MRLLFALCFLGYLLALTYAWTKEDHEIFDLVSDVEAAEGKGTTFYSWLDVSSSSSVKEINRAYRKKSIILHPDKNPGVKGAHERFARLGVIAQILRNSESRERYDFFYKNGVPTWRGTGYYYSRYRPGLGSVAVFIIALSSGVQYLIQRINYKNELTRIEHVMHEARVAAWGPKMIPVEGKRKVKVNLGGRAYMDDEGNVVSGKFIDMVVESGDVYLLDPDGTLTLLDIGAATQPSLSRTWCITLFRSLMHRIRGSSEDEEHNLDENFDGADDGSSVDASDSPGSGTSTPKKNAPGAPTALKAGGRRRVQARRRQQK